VLCSNIGRAAELVVIAMLVGNRGWTVRRKTRVDYEKARAESAGGNRREAVKRQKYGETKK